MKPDRKKEKSSSRTETPRPQRSRAEDAEPSVVPGSTPVWIFVALAVLLFGAMVYLDNHAGGFNSLVYQRASSTNQLAAWVPQDEAGKLRAAGLKVYNMPTCVSCHQPSGVGVPGQFPPLVGVEWVVESDPGHLIRIILDGITGPLEVNGIAYNNTMPPWRPTLDDEQIAAVASYVRGSWGNKAPPVTVEMVAKIRKETEGRAKPWTADELKQLPAGNL